MDSGNIQQYMENSKKKQAERIPKEFYFENNNSG